MQRFRRMRSLQKFASVYSSVYNHFNQETSLASRGAFKLTRTATFAEWRELGGKKDSVTSLPETSSNSSDSIAQRISYCRPGKNLRSISNLP